MGQLIEYIKMAIGNIRANKGRSILTMLGIIIGISSVIMIISIGNGAKATINDELNSIAGGQLYIGIAGDAKDDQWLTLDDLRAIEEKIEHVKAVTMSISNSAKARSGIKNHDAYISGGTEGMLYRYTEPIVKGKYFTDTDVESGKKVCVMRVQDAKKLFGTTEVIGMTVEITMNSSTQDFTIIGLREDTAAGLLSGGMENLDIEMPYTALGQSFHYWIDDFYGLYIIGESGMYSSQIAQSTLNLIEGRKNARGENIFRVENFEDQVSAITEVLSYITIFIVFVAAISLLVGGIGVMNIMLVSVTERTREIGIRKALGAKTKSIMMQFLSESAIITLIGGLIGITLGVLGAYGVCKVVNFQFSVQLSVVLIASLFSSAVGIIFGVYPARKAAKLSPIEALRHE
ncbi:FtsX-like permease family protein [bacterium C-53]|nr:FtsX-like permease family protein [Lachnospiraceae bacterium]NBI04796.1 FtsX-like permease family protein [Lachnospiraceae bacterium]RKJ07754.1 FtsX-like permease family protein [bacterium C-53]